MAIYIVDNAVIGTPASGTINPQPEKNIDPPKKLPSEAAGKIQPPKTLSGQSPSSLQPPNTLNRVNSGSISTPNNLNRVSGGSISTPNTLSAESSGSLQPPNVLIPNSIPTDIPLTNARILYDNLFDNAITSIVAAQGITNPNTYERWRRSGSDLQLTITSNSPVTIDAICLGAHNLGSVGSTIAIATSPDGSAAFTTRATLTPTNDNAIMVLLDSPITCNRIRLTLSGPVLNAEIGVLYAGNALVMQRPIFGGHAPITLQDKTTYIDSASDKGQWLGRTITRNGYETSYKWQFITDDFYRESFVPFIQKSKLYPFFISWRPDLYPTEVAYCWRTNDVSVTNRGGATRFVDFDLSVIGYAGFYE